MSVESADNSAPGESRPGPGVQSVDRAVDLLLAIGRYPPCRATGGDLAAASNLNRITAWRILGTLERRGLVYRDPATKCYSIGPVLVALADLAPAENWSVRAHDVLESLVAGTGAAWALALREKGEFRYVDEVVGFDYCGPSRLGTVPDSSPAMSAGKLFLAYGAQSKGSLPDEQSLPGDGDATMTTGALERELRKVRRCGWASYSGETLRAWEVSAPLLTPRGSIFGIVTCWAPASQSDSPRFAALCAMASGAARSLSGPATSDT